MNQRNVLGTELQPCSYDPMTGYYRTGCCENRGDDPGMHTVCCRVTAGVPRVLQGTGQRPVHPDAPVRLRRPAAGRPVVCVRRPVEGGVRRRERLRRDPRVHPHVDPRVHRPRRPPGPRRHRLISRPADGGIGLAGADEGDDLVDLSVAQCAVGRHVAELPPGLFDAVADGVSHRGVAQLARRTGSRSEGPRDVPCSASP